jgi:hypothetical protein
MHLFTDNNFQIHDMELPPPISISCTIVVMPSPSLPGGNLKSRIFPSLIVPSALVSNRCGINSIMIGSLLTLLRQKILAEGGISDYISEVIVGASSRFDDMQVATTRVPEFGNNLEEPIHAYRCLGLLTSLDLQMSLPPAPPAVILHDQELLALLPEKSASQEFLRSWSTMGVRPDTHFIVIFFKPEMPNISQRRSYISLDSSPSSPAPLSPAYRPFDDDVRAWSAKVYPGGNSSQTQSIVSRAASSASGMETRVFSTEYQPTTGSPSRLSYSPEGETNIIPTGYQPTPDLLPHLLHSRLGASSPQSQSIDSQAASPEYGMRTNTTATSHQPITEPILEVSSSPAVNICNLIGRTFSITGEELKSARYNSSEKKLLGMVMNHRSMIQVLERLGLVENNRFMDTKTLALPNGQVVAAVEVVKEFAWSPDSFRHKCSWYGWAEDVATSFQWNDPIPG